MRCAFPQKFIETTVSSSWVCWQKFVRQTFWPEKNFSNGQLWNNVLLRPCLALFSEVQNKKEWIKGSAHCQGQKSKTWQQLEQELFWLRLDLANAYAWMSYTTLRLLPINKYFCQKSDCFGHKSAAFRALMSKDFFFVLARGQVNLLRYLTNESTSPYQHC